MRVDVVRAAGDAGTPRGTVMSAKRNPEIRDKNALRVPMNAAELARFNALRGTERKAAYARRILLATPEPILAGGTVHVASAPPPAPEPPPPIRNEVRMPPENVPDADGLLYHWQWKGRNWGTLTLVPTRPGQAESYAVDLGDAALTWNEDGSSTITYKDRTELRTVKEGT